MKRASIRQPLVIYAVVLGLVVCLVVLAFSGLALSRASRRAYRRAVREELRLFARNGLLPGTTHPDAEVALGLVSTASIGLGVDLEAARAALETPEAHPSLVVVAIQGPGEEMYLVARVPPGIPTSIALVELSRLMPTVLLATLLAASAMAFLVYRQLLPSLSALAELADEPRTTPEGLQRPDAPNEIVEIALRFRDTTLMLRTARERAEQQRDELERMQSSLIRASKLASVGRLAAGIAHEIGNPLAAVKGYLALLRDGLPSPEREEALDRSVTALDRIHDVIGKLLTYARTGTERSAPNAPFSLRGALDEALTLARGHASLREVEIVDRVPTGDDADGVMGQSGRVGQVLINLLLNAGQAMADSDLRRIFLEREAIEGGVRLRVRDSGPGIPQDQREAIFDPFFTTKAPGEGTGLGLAVSKAMMEAMGGALEAVDSPEGGATFVLDLPSSRKGTDSH